MSGSALYEGNIVRSLDADNGEQFHKQSGRVTVFFHDRVVVGNGEALGGMGGSPGVAVDFFQTERAERRACQSDLALAEALLALPPRQFPAHRTLPGRCERFLNTSQDLSHNSWVLTILDYVGHVQKLRGHNSGIHLVVLPEPRHLYNQAGRHLLQLYVARQKALLEQLLHGRQRESVVFFDKQLVVVGFVSGAQLEKRFCFQDLREERVQELFGVFFFARQSGDGAELVEQTAQVHHLIGADVQVFSEWVYYFFTQNPLDLHNNCATVL